MGGSDTAQPVSVDDPSSLADARLCESVETGHPDHSQSAEIADRLGITTEPYRIDSQCKYGAVARGDASIYLRLPTSASYPGEDLGSCRRQVRRRAGRRARDRR